MHVRQNLERNHTCNIPGALALHCSILITAGMLLTHQRWCCQAGCGTLTFALAEGHFLVQGTL